MHINEFIMKLKTCETWDKEPVSFHIPSDTAESMRLKYIYPLFKEKSEKIFNMSGSCIYFSNFELYSVVYLISLFKNFSDDIKVYNRMDAVRFEILIEDKNTGDKEELIVQYAYTENKDYKYVQLTNIVIPSFAKFNKLSLMIISLLYLCTHDFGYDMWITQIVNERWKNTLINHGGILDTGTGEDIQITSNFWIFKDDVDKSNYCLRFNTLA